MKRRHGWRVGEREERGEKGSVLSYELALAQVSNWLSLLPVRGTHSCKVAIALDGYCQLSGACRVSINDGSKLLDEVLENAGISLPLLLPSLCDGSGNLPEECVQGLEG